MCRADHAIKLPCGKHDVCLVSRIFFIEKLHICLALFCHARHYGNRADLLRIHTEILCEISLHHRSEHLLRALRGGELRYQMRIFALDKTDPARTTGSKHRTYLCLPFFQALQKFVSFLHDRKVCGKRRIKHVVDAHLLKRTCDLADRCLLPL